MRKFSLLFTSIFFGLFSTNILADEIKLYTWENYFSPSIISQFEKETGNSVKQIFFESEMLRDTVMHTGKGDIYDLVILDGYTLNELKEEGILSKVVDQKLNGSNIFQSDASYVCGDYGIPYAYGSMGIGYRTSKVSIKLNSWMDLFDYAKEKPNSVVLIDEDIDTLAIALMALGYSPLSENEKELQEAYVLLKSTMDSLLAFRNSSSYVFEKKHSSKMDIGTLYSGETELVANATGKDDWKYIIPKEGTLIWYECLASHKNKPMNAATIDFIKFLNRPEIAIQNAQDIWFATPNKRALKLATPDYLSDNELFPQNLSEKNRFYYKKISDESLELRAKIISILSKK